eukprot:scaffold142038_cov41-Prasinocladus_malaysianus.AAC.1
MVGIRERRCRRFCSRQGAQETGQVFNTGVELGICKATDYRCSGYSRKDKSRPSFSALQSTRVVSAALLSHGSTPTTKNALSQLSIVQRYWMA